MEIKEKAKLIALAVIVVLTAIHQYFTWVVNPLRTERAALSLALETLKEKTLVEAAEFRRLSAAEEADKPNEWMDPLAGRAVKEVIENPVFACPALIQSAFAKIGVARCSVRLRYMLPFDAVRGGLLYGWIVSPAITSPFQLGMAVCEIERRNPLLQIESLTISAPGGESSARTAELVIGIPVRP